MYYSTHCLSPVGELMLASDGESLVGLWMSGQKYFAGTIAEPMAEKPELPVFQAAHRWLGKYFDGKQPSISELPLSPGGSDFRRAVLKILCEIPYGEVMTYGVIAGKMAAQMEKRSMSSQAVGGAVAHNPISIIIPCHRVVGTDGSLTGFSGGIDKKIKLLELEGVDMSRFFVPKSGMVGIRKGKLS